MAQQRYPDWIHELDDAGLVRRFGPKPIQRGRAYARTGHVGSIRVDGDARNVSADVAGSSERGYRCFLHVDDTRRPLATMSSQCTCPVSYDCKHVVAVLLHMHAVASRSNTPAGSSSSTRSPGRRGVRAGGQPPHSRWRLRFGHRT